MELNLLAIPHKTDLINCYLICRLCLKKTSFNVLLNVWTKSVGPLNWCSVHFFSYISFSKHFYSVCESSLLEKAIVLEELISSTSHTNTCNIRPSLGVSNNSIPISMQSYLFYKRRRERQSCNFNHILSNTFQWEIRPELFRQKRDGVLVWMSAKKYRFKY